MCTGTLRRSKRRQGIIEVIKALNVKKLQRSFVVEYRSARRKLNSKSNSIWGEMDLKSVAKDLQEEAMPFLPEAPQLSISGISFDGQEQVAPLSILPVENEAGAMPLQQTIMADDIGAETVTPAAATSGVRETNRKSRPRKATPEPTTVSDLAEPVATLSVAAGRQTRGRTAKSRERAIAATRAPVERAPKDARTATTSRVPAGDEIADLLQLELENKRLRRLLVDKLRAENADLRKRLNLG